VIGAQHKIFKGAAIILFGLLGFKMCPTNAMMVRIFFMDLLDTRTLCFDTKNRYLRSVVAMTGIPTNTYNCGEVYRECEYRK